MSFGCPYEGKVSLSRVHKLTQKMIDEGIQIVSISDTIGIGNPLQVEKLLNQISKNIPLSQIVLHCHNTRGMALPNILTALKCGVRKFDSSIGGLGGCPYALGASGNIATEDLVTFLNSMNFKLPIDVPQLVQISHWLKNKKKVSISLLISPKFKPRLQIFDSFNSIILHIIFYIELQNSNIGVCLFCRICFQIYLR